MQIKSWETPRSIGKRNIKSKAATARIKQLKKREKLLRNKLKIGINITKSS